MKVARPPPTRTPDNVILQRQGPVASGVVRCHLWAELPCLRLQGDAPHQGGDSGRRVPHQPVHGARLPPLPHAPLPQASAPHHGGVSLVSPDR